MEKHTWRFVAQSDGSAIEKHVKAVDPRDAMTRGLTTEQKRGKLLGEELGIPFDSLQEVPANFDTYASLRVQGFELSVQRL